MEHICVDFNLFKIGHTVAYQCTAVPREGSSEQQP
jgi:hypothetical protein